MTQWKSQEENNIKPRCQILISDFHFQGLPRRCFSRFAPALNPLLPQAANLLLQANLSSNNWKIRGAMASHEWKLTRSDN